MHSEKESFHPTNNFTLLLILKVHLVDFELLNAGFKMQSFFTEWFCNFYFHSFVTEHQWQNLGMKKRLWLQWVLLVLTVLLIGGVGEVEHSVFLQSSSCYCRIHQLVVKEQVVYRQGLSAVKAAYDHTTPTVVVVLVPHVDDDAAVRHLNRLQRGREGLTWQCPMLCDLNIL